MRRLQPFPQNTFLTCIFKVIFLAQNVTCRSFIELYESTGGRYVASLAENELSWKHCPIGKIVRRSALCETTQPYWL